MDRPERGFRCSFPSQQQQIRELHTLRQKFSGRMRKPRASRRIPNFRNQTGTCLTKINQAPNIYFCCYFAFVEAGRSVGGSGHFTRYPSGRALSGSLAGDTSSHHTRGSWRTSTSCWHWVLLMVFQSLICQLWTLSPFQAPFSHG